MGQAAAVATVVSVVGSAFYKEKEYRAEKKATKQANKLAKEQAEIERESELAALQEIERKNRNLLAQQQSSYKARLGASGLTTESGSGQVILDAMAKETDMENKYQQQKAQRSLKTLNNRLKQTNNRNLLSLTKARIGEQTNVLSAGTTLGKMSSSE